EHDQRAEQEEEPALEVAVARAADVGKCGGHQAAGFASGLLFFGSFLGRSTFSAIVTVPPAASTMARAPLLAPTFFRLILRESFPETMTFAPSAACGTMRAALSAARSISVACIFS